MARKSKRRMKVQSKIIMRSKYVQIFKIPKSDLKDWRTVGLPDLVQLQDWKNDDITIDSSSKLSTNQKPRLGPIGYNSVLESSDRQHYRGEQHLARPILYYCSAIIIALQAIFLTQTLPYTDLLKRFINYCISYPAILMFIIRYCPTHRFRRDWQRGLAVLVSWFASCCLYDQCFELVMPT